MTKEMMSYDEAIYTTTVRIRKNGGDCKSAYHWAAGETIAAIYKVPPSEVYAALSQANDAEDAAEKLERKATKRADQLARQEANRLRRLSESLGILHE